MRRWAGWLPGMRRYRVPRLGGGGGEALLGLLVEVGRERALFRRRDVVGEVGRVRRADDSGGQARVAEREAEDELLLAEARLLDEVSDARGLPVALADAGILGERAHGPVLLLRRRAAGRAAADERARALARRLGDQVLVVALDGRVRDLERVEDA